jgi:hypothetical protein
MTTYYSDRFFRFSSRFSKTSMVTSLWINLLNWMTAYETLKPKDSQNP